MKKLYCISGLGADERVFSRLKIPGVQLQYLSWIRPTENESIAAYAKRMGTQVTCEQPVLMGVSFGGMMALEIAGHIKADKVILISSIKSRSELPGWIKISWAFRLTRFTPAKPWRWLRNIENNFLGATGTEERKLANEFRETIDPIYLRWAVEQIAGWKGGPDYEPVYQIHGTRDKTFPISHIKATHVVDGGGHFMVMNRADEISGIIDHILSY